METILLGILLFFGIHTLKPAFPERRQKLINQFGEIPYKISYSLIAAFGLALMIFGYKSAEYVWLWAPLPGSPFVTHGLMLPAALLLIAANFPTSWGKAAKHPMMIGTLLWVIAHLWTNGHLKSVLLFGSFGLYAIFTLIKADWSRPVKPRPWYLNVAWIIASIVAYGFIRFLHTI